jgi:hypothetical protein
VCDELVSGEGVRQRLRDTTEASYWPRIIVTDADHTEENALAQPPLPVPAGQEDTPIADRLRFMYIGSRARAETTVQQRQPSLIETLVRQQIDSHKWNPAFSRMLFQLMVPHDSKDAARQLERLVLVVDGYTANLPWELMLADCPPESGADKEPDQRPLAVRASVVRQLAALRYRPHVVQAMAYTALVIGNPSVRGADGRAGADQARLRGRGPDRGRRTGRTSVRNGSRQPAAQLHASRDGRRRRQGRPDRRDPRAGGALPPAVAYPAHFRAWRVQDEAQGWTPAQRRWKWCPSWCS